MASDNETSTTRRSPSPACASSEGSPFGSDESFVEGDVRREDVVDAGSSLSRRGRALGGTNFGDDIVLNGGGTFFGGGIVGGSRGVGDGTVGDIEGDVASGTVPIGACGNGSLVVGVPGDTGTIFGSVVDGVDGAGRLLGRPSGISTEGGEIVGGPWNGGALFVSTGDDASGGGTTERGDDGSCNVESGRPDPEWISFDRASNFLSNDDGGKEPFKVESPPTPRSRNRSRSRSASWSFASNS